MQITTFEIPGPALVQPRVFHDERGFFYESWNQRALNKALVEAGALPEQQLHTLSFVQDNHSCSSLGVLRGLHYQLPPSGQGKLVRCVKGEIFDVAVDLRRDSPQYGRWIGAHLSAQNHHQLWIPEGFAHGFLTLSDQAEVLYKATAYWSVEHERSLLWSDPDLAIAWPRRLADGSNLTVLQSGKDQQAPCLSAIPPSDLF